MEYIGLVKKKMSLLYFIIIIIITNVVTINVTVGYDQLSVLVNPVMEHFGKNMSFL